MNLSNTPLYDTLNEPIKHTNYSHTNYNQQNYNQQNQHQQNYNQQNYNQQNQHQEYFKIQMGNSIYNQRNKFHCHGDICHSHPYPGLHNHINPYDVRDVALIQPRYYPSLYTNTQYINVPSFILQSENHRVRGNIKRSRFGGRVRDGIRHHHRRRKK